ncbi:hypothetical protein B0H14DRAFT_2984334, partial [Mycena olivaceomarginata]
METPSSLKNFDVQDEYRGFIQEKLDDIWAKYPRTHRCQENVLILFPVTRMEWVLGKLREGIISSKRVDQFTLEVYETSLYLALLTAYPSQREFRASLASVPTAFFVDGSLARVWITSLAGCIRARNYAKIDKLTQIAALPVGDATALAALPQRSNRELSRKAVYHLVNSLRNKTREMRGRELSCQLDPQLNTRAWLERSLGLVSDIPAECHIDLDEWLDRESNLGHVRRKD